MACDGVDRKHRIDQFWADTNSARKLEEALFNFCILVLIAALLRVIKFECLVGLVGAHVLPEYFFVVILHRGARRHT